MPRDPLHRHPILLGELRKLGIGLTLTCALCPRHRDIDPNDLPDGDETDIESLVEFARCTGCGRRRGGIGIMPAEWKPWIKHLRATGQHERIPPFGRMMSDD